MSVQIHQLQLEGFGRYQGLASFTLSPGLNTFVAANESGKTTLLAGLTAVLFGLPKSSDPSEWGTARFRCWSKPLHFRGEILLHDAKCWHRIRRDFATHQVQWSTAPLAKEECAPAKDGNAPGDGRDPSSPAAPPETHAWSPLFYDEHNPSARGDSVGRYRACLTDLLGIDDAELFRLVYSLTQDPEDRSAEEAGFRSREVPPSVQGLLSGSGRAVRDVLGILFDQFAEITQATKDAGLARPGTTRAVNRRQAGRIEEVRERQDGIGRHLEESRRTLEDLHGVAEELEALRQRIVETEEALGGQRRLRDAWEAWIRARRDRRTLSEQIVDLEKTLSVARSEQRQMSDIEVELKAAFPEYDQPSIDLETLREKLGALAHQDEDLAELDARLETLRSQRRELEQQAAEDDPESDPRQAAFRDRPHLERDHARWRRAAQELGELDDELARIEDELAVVTAEFETLQHWLDLDPEAEPERGLLRTEARLQSLRASLPQLLSRSEEAAALARERGQIEAQLSGPLKAAAQAPAELRAAAAQYEDRRTLHQQELKAARRRMDDLEARMQAYDARMEGVHALEEEIAAYLGPDQPGNCWDVIAEKIDEKVRGLQEEAQLLRRMDQDEQELRRGRLRLVGIPAVLGLLGGGILGALIGHALAQGAGQIAGAVLLGLAAAAAAGYLGYRQGQGKLLHDVGLARGRLSAVQRTLTETDRQLGEASRPGDGQLDLCGLDLEALTDLRGQLRNYRQQMEEHARQQVFAPSEEELGGARAAFRRAEEDLRELIERMADLGEDPSAAIQALETAERRRAEIEPRLADLTAAYGEAGGQEIPIDGLPPAWADATRLATILARLTERPAPATGGDLRAQLAGVTPEAWDAWRQETSRLDVLAEKRAELRRRHMALLDSDREGETRRAQLTSEVAELAAACQPFTLEATQEEVREAARHYQAWSEARRKAETLLAENAKGRAKLAAEREALQERLSAVRTQVEAYLVPAGDDIARARERLAQVTVLLRKRDTLASRYRAMLQSRDAEDLRALEIKVESLKADSQRVATLVHDMEERYPLFRELSGADPAQLQTRYEEVQKTVIASQAALSGLIESRDTLQARTADARAEGRRVGNVAVLELEAESLRREESRLLLERDALRIAFETLRDAEMEFGHTHRQRLESRATEIFREITCTPERAVQLDESFAIRIIDAGGQSCVARQLSQGARDQLALALRLAVADLMAEGIQPPLLLDDPFLAFDRERLAAMRETLARLAGRRQILLLSHREDLRAWGRPLEISS